MPSSRREFLDVRPPLSASPAKRTKQMRSVKFLVAAGAASLLSSVAFAADMPSIMSSPMYAPAPVEDFGGWYLRGDIGFSNQRVNRLNNVLDASTYPGGVGTDTYHATKSEWVVLANAYVDLGTWWYMTPFIGAGVGGARVSIANFTDQGIANNGAGALPGLAFGDNVAKWNFAWALHAGVAYRVTPSFTVELAYRYLDMGDGLTGDLRTFDGINTINNPTTFKSITSHDLKLGVRWNLETAPAYEPPLVRK